MLAETVGALVLIAVIWLLVTGDTQDALRCIEGAEGSVPLSLLQIYGLDAVVVKGAEE